MTLKEFFDENNVKVTPDQRSEIGRLISSNSKILGYVNEDGHNVKNYCPEFLQQQETTKSIINYLNK